jgi:phosphoenolpyruvate synthase/pyruvate phosphate dikinase
MSSYIREFATLGKNDTAIAGGKGANSASARAQDCRCHPDSS